jgi:hypothetical protein
MSFPDKQFSLSEITCERINLSDDGPESSPSRIYTPNSRSGMNSRSNSYQDDQEDISERMRMKLFGASEDEMKNWAALQRLGITYAEFEDGNSINSATPAFPMREDKFERITGYSKEQMQRSKAISVLGITEDEVYESRARKLGSIGRRESFRHG